MQKGATWLIVGALVALGAAAVADALRGEAERTLQPKPRGENAPPSSEPAALTVGGALYFSDEEDDCRLSGVRLPGLGNPAFDPATGPPPKLRSCRFSLSPTSDSVLPGEAKWAPFGTRYARQVGDRIEVGEALSGRTLRFRGSAPAFKPDGTLTYAQGKRVVAWTNGCQPHCRVLLSARDIKAASGSPVSAIRDLDWLDDTRVVIVVGTRVQFSPREEIVVFDGRVAAAGILGDFGVGLRVEASPRGGYFTAWYGDSLFTIRDRDGNVVAFPPLTGVRALAWSPDDQWTAAATEHSVFLFRTDEEDARLRRLPIVARDLAWRGPAPSTSQLHGSLVVAGRDCVPIAFRLPALPQEQPLRPPDCHGTVWSDDGTLSATCHGGVTTIVSADGSGRLEARGCAPAWRPDGALGLIRDGDVVVARRHGQPQVFVSNEELVDWLNGRLTSGEGWKPTALAWIDPTNMAAILEGPRPAEQALAIMSPDELELFVREFGQHIDSLQANGRGDLAFARNRLSREYVMLRRGGNEVPLPRIANARAFAWSPDGEWVAIATRTATFIARAGTREVVLRVPSGGDALAWEP
jgi:hypothetical protein